MNEFPIFKTLFLLARPAAGKSEILHYLRNIDLDQRIKRFHIGEMLELDDFPMLWTWFEEDEILERLGKPRLHSTPAGYFKYIYLWDILTERLCLEYSKIHRDLSDHANNSTILIEFSRGAQHGGYKRAFKHIDKSVAENAAILYVDVSYDESLRKNRKRFNPDRPDSILEHGLSDEKMEKLYKETDWHSLIAPNPDWIKIQGTKVPCVTMPNDDDVTSQGGDALGDRLQVYLEKLWGLMNR